MSLRTINTAFEHIEETLVDVQVVHAGRQDQNAKERIDAARKCPERQLDGTASEPVAVSLSTHDGQCLRTY